MLFDSDKIKKRFILFLVKRIIGKYINNNISSDSVNVSLNGFTIQHLELDPYLLSTLDVPFELVKSSIVGLEVFIPWSDLWYNIHNANTKLHIKEINLHLKWIYKQDFDNFIDRFNTKTKLENSFMSYLQQSIIADKKFILPKEIPDSGIVDLQAMILNIIESITIGIDVIKLNLDVNNVIFSLEIYDINFSNNQEQADELFNYNESKLHFRVKRLTFEELVIAVNKSNLITIQKSYMDLCMYNTQEIHHLNIIVKLGFAYISVNESSIKNTLVVIAGIYEYLQGIKLKKSKVKQEFKLKCSIPKMKFNILRNADDNIQIVSSNIIYINETNQSWGSYDHNNTLAGTKHESTLQMNIVDNKITQETSSNFNFDVEAIDIIETLNTESYIILRKKNSDTKSIYTLCKTNSDIILMFVQPIIVTLDPNILNRYNHVICAITNNLEFTNKTIQKVTVFTKRFMIMCYSQLFQLHLRIPIHDCKDFQTTFMESLLFDLINVQLSVSSEGVGLSFKQLYVSIIADKTTTTIAQIRSDKYSSIKLYSRDVDTSNDNLPEWFIISRINVGQQDLQYLETLNDIDIENVGKQLIKKTKLIVRSNIYNVNVFIGKTTFDLLINLLGELGKWKSPNETLESYYILSYCKIHNVTYNIYWETYKYGLTLENVNVFNAMNFYTNTQYANFQIGNLALNDHVKKRIILKRGGYGNKFVLGISTCNKLAVNVRDLKLFLRDDFEWVNDIIGYFKSEDIEPSKKTVVYVTVEKCSLNYCYQVDVKIPSLRCFSLEDINGVNCTDTRLELILTSNVEILNLNTINILWDSSTFLFDVDKVVIGLCADSLQALTEISTLQTKNNVEIEEYNENVDVQSLIRDAIKATDTSNNNSMYFGSVSVINFRKKSVKVSTPSPNLVEYAKMAKIRKTEINLYAGLDNAHSRNHNSKITMCLVGLNFIKYDERQNLITVDKNIMTIQQVKISFLEGLTNTVFTMDSSNFQSATLYTKEEMKTINRYLKKNAQNMLYNNCSTFICNTFRTDLLDVNIEADLQPMTVNLNQAVIYFIIRFMTYKPINDYMDKREEDEFKIIEKSKVFINRIKVNDVNVILNYKSSVFDMSYGKTPVILSLMKLNETKIKLGTMIISGIPLDKLLEKIKDHYVSEIKTNNSLSIISSIAPIKTVINIGAGVVNLIIMPCKGIYHSNLKYGVKKGISSFKTQTLAEIANVLFNIVDVADRLINGKREEIVITIPDEDCDGKSIVALVANIAQTGLKRTRNGIYEIKHQLETP